MDWNRVFAQLGFAGEHGVGLVGGFAVRAIRERLAIRVGKQALASLSPGEIEVLKRYILGKTKTLNLDLSSGITKGLEARQIIY